VRAVAWVLASHASWADHSTRPTWPVLQDRSGLSRRSVARWLAWLRAEGLLGVIESGSTPALRPMALAGLQGNRAALYVLTVPHQAPVAGRPSETPAGSGTPPEDLSFGEDPDAGARPSGPLRGPELPQTANHWPLTRPAASRRERLELVQRLQNEIPLLRRLPERQLRSLLRPWLQAGWTAADVRYGLDHDPAGALRTWTTAVRSPSGWLLSRLAAWRDAAGRPLAPLSAAAAVERERLRDVQRRRHDQADAHAARAGRAERWSAVIASAAGELLERLEDRALTGRPVRPRRGGPLAASLVRSLVLAELPRVPGDVTTRWLVSFAAWRRFSFLIVWEAGWVLGVQR